VGEVFEERYANRIEEFAPLLARHFQEAGDDERTLRYATVAGDHAAKLYANADAVIHYEHAIEAGRRLGRSEEPVHHLYPSRGRALELSGRYDEAIANDEAWRAMAEDVGDRSAVLGADLVLATLHSTPTPRFDAERGRALSERTLALARELGDRMAESKALWNLMILNVFGGGDLREALDAGERSLEIARELEAREQMAFTLNDLWRPYAAVGDLAASRATLEEATPIWRELGNLPMLSENLASIASLKRMAGEESEALALSLESYRISEEIGNLWGQSYALMNAFGVYLDRGELASAMAAMEESIALSERVGFIPPQATTRSELALVYAYLGDFERAEKLLEVALRVVNELQPISRPWATATRAEFRLLAGDLRGARSAILQTNTDSLPEPLRSGATFRVAILRGRIAAAEGDHEGAVVTATEVVERLGRLGILPFVAEAKLLQGTSLAALGRWPEAEGVLREARAGAEALDHRRVLWQILCELGRVRAAEGDAEEASRLKDEAGRIVLEIASTIDDESLRASFLTRPDVVTVLAER
jgi:tetratricopeptide (TPR) repeat protein